MSGSQEDGQRENAEHRAARELHGNVAAADRALDADQESERQDIVIHAGYELFVAGFLVVQLINSVLLFAPLLAAQRRIVVGFWLAISLFLFLDAFTRWRRGRKGRRFVVWVRWIGSLPMPFITSVRLAGTAYALRALRRGDVKEIGRIVIARHAQSTLLLVIFAAVLVFEFGSLMILVAEQLAPDANITTSGDALWWSLVTISTVGYGDTYPVTLWGRFIGVLLIVAGVGLFTSVTSFLARWFITPRETTHEPLSPEEEVVGTHAQIAEIRGLLAQLHTTHANAVEQLEERLTQLEDALVTGGYGKDHS